MGSCSSPSTPSGPVNRTGVLREVSTFAGTGRAPIRQRIGPTHLRASLPRCLGALDGTLQDDPERIRDGFHISSRRPWGEYYPSQPFFETPWKEPITWQG